PGAPRDLCRPPHRHHPRRGPQLEPRLPGPEGDRGGREEGGMSGESEQRGVDGAAPRTRALFDLDLERALRRAAVWHCGQERRGSGVPYVQHAMAVALILDRLGYSEEVVVAGLLHDVVEDTEATLDQVREAFGDEVTEIVSACSEVKKDDQGR